MSTRRPLLLLPLLTLCACEAATSGIAADAGPQDQTDAQLTTADTAADTALADSTPTDTDSVCPKGEQACQCASGHYCLPGNAMCIGPGAPCPSPVDAISSDTGGCPPGNHPCTCATGSYCLAMGAACISSDSPCPDGG